MTNLHSERSMSQLLLDLLEIHRRAWEVAEASAEPHGPNVDPVEVWYLDAAGRITEVERAEDVRRATQ